MSTGDRIRDRLLDAGGRLPSRGVNLLSGAANFVVMGQRLREHGIRRGRCVWTRYDVLGLAVADLERAENPLYLEFGVYTGDSMRYVSRTLKNPRARLVGFDSFEGLPEDWLPHAPEGQFSTNGNVPQIEDDRVGFVAGWFDESLRTFEVPEHDRLLVNIDADLYSSAATVLGWAGEHLQAGDLVYFDEFTDRFHEYRAFVEFLDATGQRFEAVGATRGMRHALFRRVG